MSEEVRFFRGDMRDEGGRMCNAGARLYFKRMGWSWSDFVTKGWTLQEALDKFEESGDPVIKRMIDTALERRRGKE